MDLKYYIVGLEILHRRTCRTSLTTDKPPTCSSGRMGWLCPTLPGKQLLVCLFVCNLQSLAAQTYLGWRWIFPGRYTSCFFSETNKLQSSLIVSIVHSCLFVCFFTSSVKQEIFPSSQSPSFLCLSFVFHWEKNKFQPIFSPSLFAGMTCSQKLDWRGSCPERTL